MKRFRAAGAMAVLATALLSVYSSIAVARPWTNPSRMFAGAHGINPRVLALTDGSTLAVLSPLWHGQMPPTSPVVASLRGPFGSFSDPQAITPWGAAASLLVAGPSGRAALVYYDSNDSKYYVKVRGPAGFSDRSTVLPGYPTAGGFDRYGNATFLLGPSYGTVGALATVTRRVDGHVGPLHRVDAGDSNTFDAVGLAVAPNGTTTVVWREGVRDNRVMAATALRGQSFGPAQTIASKSYSEAASIAVRSDGAGDVLVAWNGEPSYSSFGLHGFDGFMTTSFRPAGGNWGLPKRIPGASHTEVSYPWCIGLAMNDRGDAVLAWSLENGVTMTYRSAGGDFEPTTIAPGEPIASTAIGPSGDAIVVHSVGEHGTTLESIDHPSGGGFEPPQRIGKPAESDGARIAVNAFSEAIAVWLREPPLRRPTAWTATHRIQAPAGSSGLPPTVSGLSVTDNTNLHFRLSRPARVSIRLSRIGKQGRRRRVGTMRAVLHGGANSIVPTDDLLAPLSHRGRYLVTFVAIDRAGRRSKPRSLTFSTPVARS